MHLVDLLQRRLPRRRYAIRTGIQLFEAVLLQFTEGEGRQRPELLPDAGAVRHRVVLRALFRVVVHVPFFGL